jgi:hypothetical protein
MTGYMKRDMRAGGTTPRQPKHNYEALGFGMRSAAVVQKDRMLVRRGIDEGFRQDSVYQNPQHADRRARTEDGAYSRAAAKRLAREEADLEMSGSCAAAHAGGDDAL